MQADVIDTLAGIVPGSHLDTIRRTRRPVAREHAQKSYDALFSPADDGGFAAAERFAIATFVAGVHGEDAIRAFYAAKAGRAPALDAEIAAAKTRGPYGAFPKGPLSREDSKGPIHRVADSCREALGPRLVAALAHVHMLVFHPRDADARSLQSLLDVGWTTTQIVTLSQLVAFLSFQIRAVAGLRVLAAQS